MSATDSTYPGLLIRIFHWTLFFTIILLFFTEQLPLLHADLGYLAFFLIVIRVVWGIWGRSARLRNYPLNLEETINYYKGVITGKPVEYPAMSPASAWVAVLFYMVITLLTLTGIVTLATTHYEGVWVSSFAFLDDAASLLLKKMHFYLSGVLLGLMALHISGALIACFQHRRNIIKPMIFGKIKTRSDI